MFDFLFKRPSAAESAAGTKSANANAPQEAAPDAQATQQARQQEKQLALQQAQSLGNDENAAADFIIACPFADARLLAAEHIQSKAALERVLAAIRNLDRRVAKLMQQRLQALAHQAAQQQQIASCIVQAEKLLAEAQLTANHVADLDRSWQLVAAGGEHADFTRVRQALDARLQQQLQLQRTIRDHIAEVRQMTAAFVAASANGDADVAAVAAQLTQLTQTMAASQLEREITSVPKFLLGEFQTEQHKLEQLLSVGLKQIEQQLADLQSYEQALSEWEAKPEAELSAADLKRRWNKLPRLPQSDVDPLQARFDQLLQKIAEATPPAVASDGATPAASAEDAGAPAPGHELADGQTDEQAVIQAAELAAKKQAASVARANKKAEAAAAAAIPPDPAALQKFATALAAMEQALEQGLLHAAFDHDKTMRDLKSVKPGKQQSARMAQARAELHRLQGWAKWGGNVSREELIRFVDELPQQNLAIPELAQKVGSMRERWKKLDVASGAAPKPLWDRFDSACTAAYAPAAAHFKKLAEERQQNMQQAEALVAQVVQHNAAFNPENADWKHIAALHQRWRQAWHQLGPIERKDKKRLDTDFERRLAVSFTPLQEQRRQEMARREALIAEVEACNPQQRNTLDQLRQLQERWQELAKALPLERKPEQELWQRFRKACDAIFAARKETAQVMDSERRKHLHDKEALCATLEAALELPAADQNRLLRSTQDDWQQIGAVPRAQEQNIEQRFHQARQKLQNHLEQVKRQAKQADGNSLRSKLHLCQQLESALCQNASTMDADAWRARWQALPAVAGELETVLSQRFEAALTGDAQQYAAKLLAQADAFLPELLRLEITLGIDSPPAFARERLKIQVEVLQSSLRSGHKAEAPQAQIRRLCAWPALLDGTNAKRLDKVLLSLLH
jgi:hypothetical protein